jgi:predicted protein tyrosine phosphatase
MGLGVGDFIVALKFDRERSVGAIFARYPGIMAYSAATAGDAQCPLLPRSAAASVC